MDVNIITYTYILAKKYSYFKLEKKLVWAQGYIFTDFIDQVVVAISLETSDR
jgi:hypothetical protein